MFESDPILPVIRSGVAVSPLPVVTAALIGAGLPAEAAAKFADVAVEAVRAWLWGPPGLDQECCCDPLLRVRGEEDPQCYAHGYDRMLGGDGHGERLTAAQQREQIVAAAERMREQVGEERYSEAFAATYLELLEHFDVMRQTEPVTAE